MSMVDKQTLKQMYHFIERKVEQMTEYSLDKMKQSSSPGIMWGGGYNSEYERYEQAVPFAFPYENPKEDSKIRFVKGNDGWWYNPDAKEISRAILCCTGDLMCEPQQHAAYKYGNDYFFHPEFKFVRNILKGADFSVGNLETTLTELTPYAGTWHRIEGKYHCNAPKAFLAAIRYAGFDALVNANNHNCDSAVAGLMDTLDALDEYQFMHTGTFRPDEDERILRINVNGIKLAVLSYATYFNHLEENFTELGRNLLLNEFSEEKVRRDVAYARKCGADFVLAYIHWGKEYTHEVSEKQKKNAVILAEAGVDYIVGSHSHSLQPRRTVHTTDGRDVPVVYSMGNFVTNEPKSISKHTGILQLVLEKNAAGVCVHETFIPCYVFDQARTSAFAPVPTDVILNGGFKSDRLKKAETYIRAVMDELPEPKTAAMDIDELCSVLSVPRPDSIPNQPIMRFCSKPENIVSGAAFFGIIWNSKSELSDAHKKGAAVVITNRAVENVPCIVVDDVNKAYCDVYNAIRSRFDVTTILVTGSVGKTTTKEILDHVIRSKYTTLSSTGNLNTRHTGMLVMQKLRDFHKHYIQEVHEGDPNSAAMMSKALTPEYCIITNVDSAHREMFNSDEDFLKCFTDITAGLKEGGTLFVNGDDSALMSGVKALGQVPYRIVTFGLDRDDLDYKGENISVADGWLEMDIVYEGGRIHAKLCSPVKKNAYNVLAAFAVGRAANIDEEQIVKAITCYESDGIRQNVVEYRGLKMLLDCRSAAPTSVVSSINAFLLMEPRPHGKRVAVIGDMHLNDEESETEHRKIGAFIAETNIDYLLCYGKESKFVYQEAINKGFDKARAHHYDTKSKLEKTLYSLLAPGDTLLIKGGRRMYLNSTIRKLFGYTISID